MSNWLPDETTEWGGRPVARTVADALLRCRATVTGTLASAAVLDDGTGVIFNPDYRFEHPRLVEGR